MRPTVALVASLTLISPAFAWVAPALAGPSDRPRHEPRLDRERFAEHLEERSDRLADALDLTDDQRAAFETLRSQSLEGARPKFERLRVLGDELRTLLDAAAPDAVAVGTKAIALHRLREELGAARDAFEAELDNLLTREQRFAFDALQRARRDFEGRGPRGFGRGFRHGAGQELDDARID